jgi:transcriptional regulator with PAS, ATPase and Fis domain
MVDKIKDINVLLKELEVARESKNPEKIDKALQNCGDYYQSVKNYTKTIDYLNEALPYISSEKYPERYAHTLLRIANLYLFIPELDTAIYHAEQALSIFTKLEQNIRIADCYNCFGHIYRYKGMYEESLDYAFKAIAIYEHSLPDLIAKNDRQRINNLAAIFEVVSAVYGQLNQLEKAREYLHKTKDIYESIDSKVGVMKAFINLGVTYSKENLNLTLQYYQQALAIAEEKKDYFYIGIINNNIGGVYEDFGKYSEAISQYKKAFSIMEKHNCKRYQPFTLKFIGDSYYKLKDYKNALDYSRKALDLTIDYKMNIETEEIYRQISRIHEDMHEYKRALQFIKKSMELKEQIFNKELSDKMTSLQKKYEETSKQLVLTKTEKSLVTETMKKSMNMSFIGKSASIKKVYELAMAAAAHKDTNVLVSGESGTGKEIIAHIIHYASVRKEKLFIPVNCSSIPETLIEGEFFGYQKGAFTGAKNDHIGYLEAANGGTLFLDEIADTPLSMQAKLLRVLENKKIKKLGSNCEIQVDFRVITATNKDVKELISQNVFRLDLLYRFNTIEILIPPLRDRTEDIEPLLEHFIMEFSKLLRLPIPKVTDDLIPFLKEYSFPGNVRELKNMIERAMIMNRKGFLEPSLFVLSPDYQNQSFAIGHDPVYSLKEMEKRTIQSALKKSENNLTTASKLLGISYSTMQRKVKEFKL